MADSTSYEVIWNSMTDLTEIKRMVRVYGRFWRREKSNPVGMAVYIDGACRGNGTPNAVASWGVYFGPDSSLNRSGLLPSNVNHTSTRAEIEALRQAMDIIEDNYHDFIELSWPVWIFTDSSYLYNTVTSWYSTWLLNGGRTARGEEAKYFDEHMYIDNAWINIGRDSIRFELIRRDQNKGADRLANLVLDDEARRKT